MFTLAFWKATAERVIASFIGAVLAVWGVVGFDITALDWGTALKVGGGAALVSLLKAILAVVTTGGGPSLTNSETLAQTATVTVPADGVARVVEFEAPTSFHEQEVQPAPRSADTKADAAYHGLHEGQ